MPTIRYQIRNEYGLSDPDLYRAADKDDPEAVLEGVAMAGLVGVLRQLGDLTEFAAGIFHDLHEEVTATAARGHGLMLRVQQLEAEFPSIEKAFLVKTNYSQFAYDEGLDYRANLRINQNLITQGEMPRFILDSYEECRGPPRLFILDKFDVAGAGACLKRYSDPSLFKVEFASSGMMEEDVQRGKKPRKIRKRALRWRNADTESFLAPLFNSYLQQERDDQVSARGPNRRVKLKSRNLHELDIANRRSYMEHLLDVHALEQKVWPENSISHSPVDVKPIKSSGLTSEVHETVIDKITDSTIIREAYPTQSPTRKEVTYIPRNELDGCHVKSVRKLKFIPKERIMTESEIKAEVNDDGYMPCKAEIRSPLLQDMELRKSFTDGESTIKDGSDGGKSNGYRSDEAEKNPARESWSYSEFNPVGEYEDYRSDNVSSDLENYVDALNTIGSEIETDSKSRVKADPGFFNMVDHTIDSVIYEHQQEVAENPFEPDSVEKFISSREENSVVEHSTTNSVVSRHLIDTQRPLHDEILDNFRKVSPVRTPDEIQGNNEVRESALLPIKTSYAKESYVTSIMSEVRETSAESLVLDLMCNPLQDGTGSNYMGDTLVDVKESDVTTITSEVRETLAESSVMDLMCSPLRDGTSSNYVGDTLVVSQQLDGKAEGLHNFSNHHDDFSCETQFCEVGNLSFSGRYMPEGIDPAECVEEQTSAIDMSGHHSKDHCAPEENAAQHVEESTLTLTSNAEDQQESVKEDVLLNITEASPENGASIVHPAVLAEEIHSNDVKNSHEVTRDLDGILPRTDIEFTDPIINSRILSYDLLPLSDIQHTEDVGPVSFKDTEDTQGETIPQEALIGHVEDSPPLSSMQLRASDDPMEQDHKASSCEIMSPGSSALSLENNHVTKQPAFFARGVKNTVALDEYNAEVVDERGTLLPAIVPAEFEYLSDVDDSQKFNEVNSEELLTLSSEKETFLDDLQPQLNSSAEDARENNIVMPNLTPLKLSHFPDVEEPESCNADSRDKVPVDSASMMSSDDMQLRDEESVYMANSNAEESKESPLPELDHFSDVEEPESCNADSRDNVPLDSASVISSADMQLHHGESECVANSGAEESKESPLAASVEHLPLDSVNDTFLDDKKLSNKENDHMAASNVEDPKESSSVGSGEHYLLDSVDEMFPDDIQVRNKELCCMKMDGPKSAADTMGLLQGSDLQKDSLQLEKQIDDVSLDEYVVVEAVDNSQGTCYVYPYCEKTYGLDVQLLENYLPPDAALNQHGMEVKDSSDHDILAPPSQFESQQITSTEISSSILPIQYSSDYSNPSDAELLDNVCCMLSCENSKPNINKEDLMYSSENEDYGSKEGISPSTHSLVERNTPPGDDSEPIMVFSHEEVEEHEYSDMQFQRPCTTDNKSFSKDIEDRPSQPELCIVDSKGESIKLDTSLCNIDKPENLESEASVASRHTFEISESQPIAISSQSVSESSLQDALETWLDEPTSSFQLPDVDRTPPLPPLPPLEWRLGNLRLAPLTSSGDTIQPPVVTNPFVKQTAGEEKYLQDPMKAAVEMFQAEKPSASLPVVENERCQHGSFISEEEIVQSSRSSESAPIADEERKHKSLSIEAEMINPSSSLPLSHGEDGKFTTGQGEWQHGQHKRTPLAHLIPSLELERSQHEAPSVARDPILPMNPFFIGPSIEEWNLQYGYGVYGGGSMQQLNLPPPLDARGLNMPPHGFLYSMGENPSTVYNFMIPMADGDKPNWTYRSIRDRPRDPLIEAVAAHDKSKLRKVTEQDRPSGKQKTDERDSLLEQIRNKSFNLKPANATKPDIMGVPPLQSFNLKPANATKPNIKGVPPTNLKVAAILEKANAIRQACAGSDEDDGDGWSDN